MERESNMQAPPALCRSGCGFYGNPATEGMCSVCFKEAVKKKQQPPAASMTGRSSPTSSEPGNSPAAAAAAASQCLSTASTTVPTVSVAASVAPPVSEVETIVTPSLSTATSSSSLSSSVVDTDSDAGSVTNKDAKKKKNRCATCNKKVGLTGFECRCGGLYCSVHRYSDKHECSFNYRELGAEEIRRNNPVVVGQKIQKI